MKTINIKRTIKGLSLASAMVLGLIIFSGSDANAQYRGDRDNDNYGNQGRYDNRVDGREIKAAKQRGYEQGFQQGLRDARNRRGNNGNWGNNGGFNNGGFNNGVFNGNFGGFGNNFRIQQAYREGFEKGYRDGLKRGRNNDRIRIWPF